MMDWIYRKRKNRRSLLILHDDILVLIFTRLSITKILECKTVCKSLYLVLSSRYFADSYKSNPPFTTLIIDTDIWNSFSLLELNSGYNCTLKSSKPKILPDPYGLSFCGFRTRYLVGSCNGFFCFCDKDLLYVSNPLSGTHVRLPEVSLDGVYKSSYGFGYCPQTQHLKVIEIATYVRPFSRTEVNVFTVGIDKSWRRIHCPYQHIQQRLDADYPLIKFLEVNGKGYSHWIVGDVNRLDYLYSFDILEEKVRPIPTPVGLKKINKSTELLFKHGCVCLLHMNEYGRTRVEFWCMTDYMVQGSWTLRILSHSPFPPKEACNIWYQPVAIWKDEEILMLSNHGTLVSSSLEQRNFYRFCLPRLVSRAAVCFVPNFFSNLETGTGTPLPDTTDVAARKLGLLLQKCSKPTQVGNARASIRDNILSRVFIKCCKHVFNIWCKFLSDPTVHLIILCDKASPRFLFELKSDFKNNVKDCPPFLAATSSSMAKITVLGSCNGLMCLSVSNGHHPDHQTHDICICNPVVQEVTILPRHDGVKQICDEAYGFGFSSMTGQYKVLRMLTRRLQPGQLEVYVLTIGVDRNWRQVAVGSGTTYFRMPKKWPEDINKARFCDVPFNNAIHWVAEGDSKFMIYAFDIDKEQISLLSPIPGSLSPIGCLLYHVHNRYYYPCLGILGGRLCVSVTHHIRCNVVEFWSMRTYGSVASWTNESIYVSRPRSQLQGKRKVAVPVMSWRDEEEILMWIEDGGGTLISYCSRKKRFTKIKIDVAANNEALIPIPFVQSDLSLKDAIQSGDLEVYKMVIQTPFRVIA